MATLFRLGDFVLSSGVLSSWKIDCDVLTIYDWRALAKLIRDVVGPFSEVEGIPVGGSELARGLAKYKSLSGGLLIVDDVLTTGHSMEAHRAGREAKGAVVFARGPCPDWVQPLFMLNQSLLK